MVRDIEEMCTLRQDPIKLGIGWKKSSLKHFELDSLEGIPLCISQLPSRLNNKASAISKSYGHVINIGFPVWALDFLPQLPPAHKSSQAQYIAVAGLTSFNTRQNIYVRELTPNIIQIWALESSAKKGRSKKEGKAYLATVISHSWGACWGLKFCPYGAYGKGRMGLLAGVFGDGHVRVLDVRDEWLRNGARCKIIRVSEAAWEYSMGEQFLATCVAWKSHTEIIVASSSGIYLNSCC
jgi:hypothetical protein